MDRARRDERGFTLIELLVVVMIIGLLAAIAIPAFLNQKGKAVDAGAKELAHVAQVAAEDYATDNGGSYANLTPAVLSQYEPTIQTSLEQWRRLRLRGRQRHRQWVQDHGHAGLGQRDLHHHPVKWCDQPDLHRGRLGRDRRRLRQRHLVALRFAGPRPIKVLPAAAARAHPPMTTATPTAEPAPAR